MLRAFTVFLCATCMACATTSNKRGDVELLKPTLEAFHRGMRWKDFRHLPPQLVPDKRAAFSKASVARDDEKNLFVTDYQLEECDVQPNAEVAVCMSRVSWYRLPSATEKTVTVATTLKWQDHRWLIDQQSDGPFAEELALGPKSP